MTQRFADDARDGGDDGDDRDAADESLDSVTAMARTRERGTQFETVTRAEFEGDFGHEKGGGTSAKQSKMARRTRLWMAH